MDINSTLNIPEASEPAQKDDSKLDDLLFGDNSDDSEKDSFKQVTKLQSKEDLLEKLNKLKKRVNSKSGESNFGENILEKLEEIEREASSLGVRNISATISHLKIKAEDIFSEAETMLDSEDLLKLKKDKLTKVELKKIQKALFDIEQTYEERIENLWTEVEELEYELEGGSVSSFASENSTMGQF